MGGTFIAYVQSPPPPPPLNTKDCIERLTAVALSVVLIIPRG